MELPKRKPNRLPAYDYSTPGAYFLTICTQNRMPVLGRIVGGGALDAPHICLSPAGEIVEKYILSGNQIPGITLDKYVIMPNHIHLLLFVDDVRHGASKAPPPYKCGDTAFCIYPKTILSQRGWGKNLSALLPRSCDSWGTGLFEDLAIY